MRNHTSSPDGIAVEGLRQLYRTIGKLELADGWETIYFIFDHIILYEKGD